MELTKRINLAKRIRARLSFKLIKNILDFLLDDSKYGRPNINEYLSYERGTNMNSNIFR